MLTVRAMGIEELTNVAPWPTVVGHLVEARLVEHPTIVQMQTSTVRPMPPVPLGFKGLLRDSNPLLAAVTFEVLSLRFWWG